MKVCKTCGGDYTPHHSTAKYCSDLCTPYKNWAMAWDVWRSMHKRCKDPKTNQYKNYGGSGITVCKDWEAFPAFLRDVGYRPSRQHQLDRIDSSKGYFKDNVRWVTCKENIRNKSTYVPITWQGQTKSTEEWATELGYSRSAFHNKLKRLGVEKAFTTPKHPTGPKSSPNVKVSDD